LIITTSACRSLKEEFKPGEIVVIDSFIDRTTKREQTFYDGKPGHPPGVCHIPMCPTYNDVLREIISLTTKYLKLNFHSDGTLVGLASSVLD
jgi:5'-methylthioadenosine phosphorylase